MRSTLDSLGDDSLGGSYLLVAITVLTTRTDYDAPRTDDTNSTAFVV